MLLARTFAAGPNSQTSAAERFRSKAKLLLARYPEIPFHSYNTALLGNLTFEYTVFTTLFSPSTPFPTLSAHLSSMFAPVFSLANSLTRALIATHTTDTLSLLLLLRLTQSYAFTMQRHKIPIADPYINGTNLLLWPRFMQSIDAHCQALSKFSAASPASRATSAALSIVAAPDASKSSSSSVAPHPVTQRFAHLVHGILVLSPDAGDDEPVGPSLARLRAEYEACVQKLAKSAGGDAAKRARFVSNNYSLVLTIIGDTGGKLADEMKEALVQASKAR